MQTETDVRWSIAYEGGVELVSVVLWSGRPRRVRVRPTVEGPVWPPREAGVPVEGWDGERFEATVDGRRSVGFAARATNAADESSGDDPPVDVTWLGPAEPAATFDRHRELPAIEATTAGVVRALGDPTPPRDAIPDGRPAAAAGSVVDAGTLPAASNATDPEPTDLALRSTRDSLAAVEHRVEMGEALADADSLESATEAVERAGGLDAVRALRVALGRDVERLGGLEAAESLRERAERATVPVETLERLA